MVGSREHSLEFWWRFSINFCQPSFYPSPVIVLHLDGLLQHLHMKAITCLLVFKSPNKLSLRLHLFICVTLSILILPIPDTWPHTVSHPLRIWAGNNSGTMFCKLWIVAAISKASTVLIAESWGLLAIQLDNDVTARYKHLYIISHAPWVHFSFLLGYINCPYYYIISMTSANSWVVLRYTCQ